MSIYEERMPPELSDPEDMAEDLRQRSEQVADAANYWFEQGWNDFRPGLDIEEVVMRFTGIGHPHLVKCFRDGWEIARKDQEASDAQAPASA